MEEKGYEKVIDYIISYVQQNNVEIGDSIPSERAISQELSVGRNSVREGVRVLQTVGILSSQHGKGNIVSDNTTNGLSNIMNSMLILNTVQPDEIIEFRKHMELSIYTLAFSKRNANKYLIFMGQILDSFMDQPLEEKIRLDGKLHHLLVEMADNTLMTIIMNSISNVYSIWVRNSLESMDSIGLRGLHEAHVKIYESLLEGDEEAGRKAISRHYAILDAYQQLEKNEEILDNKKIQYNKVK